MTIRFYRSVGLNIKVAVVAESENIDLIVRSVYRDVYKLEMGQWELLDSLEDSEISEDENLFDYLFRENQVHEILHDFKQGRIGGRLFYTFEVLNRGNTFTYIHDVLSKKNAIFKFGQWETDNDNNTL